MFIMTALLHGIIKRICSVSLLPEEINEITKFASWNGFPKSISTSKINRALNQSINDSINQLILND